MKVLVTGVSGFIAGILARELHRQEGIEVIGLSRSRVSDVRFSDMRVINCDLQKEIALEDEVDYIVHCAAIQNSKDMSAKDFIESNLEMITNIALYGKKVGVKGLFFTSSIDLYGDVKTDIVTENTDRINPSLYGISKYLCELLLQEYQTYFPVVALRLCGVVGPGAVNGWVASALMKAKRGEPIGIVNADRLFNNILHTDDICRFIQELINNGFTGFTAFPLASKQPLTIKNMVSEMIMETGSHSEIVDYGVTNNSFMISNDFAINHFDFKPSDVLANLKKFVREN